MDTQKILKSSQEQGVAAWIGYLNQLRIDALTRALMAQDGNLKNALQELAQAKIDIFGLIDSNRGGATGVHGFIAERAEVGIENARNLVVGKNALAEWLNDNGPADLQRAGVEIQQKFVQSNLGLNAIREHLEKYPQFVAQGNKYQIPKDFYEKLQKLMDMTKEEANKLPKEDWRLWRFIQTFFQETGLTPDDIEPSVLGYKDVQRGQIDRTLEKETTKTKKTDQERRNAAIQDSKPTLKEGAQATAVSAGVEAGISLLMAVAQKRKQGKPLSQFTAEDWKDVGLDTAGGAVKGAIRGGVVYGLTNFTATPAPVASALVTATFGVVAQAYQLEQGNLTPEEFVVNAEMICVDVAVGSVSALIGQVAIPIPVLGAIIGNAAGMFLYGIVKDHLGEQEQNLIAAHREGIERLNQQLEIQYQVLVAQLKEKFAQFSSILQLAFDLNVNKAFGWSIQLADHVGVPQEKVLRSMERIDRFFQE